MHDKLLILAIKQSLSHDGHPKMAQNFLNNISHKNVIIVGTYFQRQKKN